MRKRAQAFEDTRDRIIRATLELHGEQGVVATSQTDIAARAGVAPATVYRHFPTLGLLFRACGARVLTAVRPPQPEDADRLFKGLNTTPQRLRRFVDEVCDFYVRAFHPLHGSRQERDRVPELDDAMRQVEAALEALAREALALERPTERQVQLVVALTDFDVWRSLRGHGVSQEEAPQILTRLVECALGGRGPQPRGSTR